MKIIDKRKFERMQLLCSKRENKETIKSFLLNPKRGRPWHISDSKVVHKLSLMHYQGRIKKNRRSRIKDPFKIMKTYTLFVCERPL